MVGFKVIKNANSEQRFRTTYQSIEDIKKAFLTQDEAVYALLGLVTALQEGIPPVLTCLTPHNNRFTIEDLEECIAELKLLWISQTLTVVLFISDVDSKGLGVLEILRCDTPDLIGLSSEGWIINAKYQ